MIERDPTPCCGAATRLWYGITGGRAATAIVCAGCLREPRYPRRSTHYACGHVVTVKGPSHYSQVRSSMACLDCVLGRAKEEHTDG